MAKKKYFIKADDGIYTVTDEFFDDIESRDEALVIVMRAMQEISSTLKDEALEKDSIIIGSLKVTTGLQRSIDELNKRWPNLLEQIYAVPRCIDGQLIDLN